MADKRIDELEAAASVTPNDLFVLEQAGVAKKLTSFILEQWLLALAQGRGGITSIAKTSSTGTNPVVDTYTITFSDASTTTFNVTNGVKGDTGAQTYVYIKYSAIEPTQDSDLTDTPSAWMGICATTSATAPTTYGSYSWYEIKGANTYIKYSNRNPIADSDMTDTPSAWMGVCVTTATTAPTTYGSYSWYEIKGAKGDPGNDITVVSTSVMYQAWSSGTQYPTGTWLDNPPAVTPGNYLWTRTIVVYSDGQYTTSYSVGRWGLDGSGAVSSVNNELPDQNGNVTLTANDVGAMPDSYQPPVTSVQNKNGDVFLTPADVSAMQEKTVEKNVSGARWYRAIEYDAYDGYSANGYSGEIVTIKIIETSSVSSQHEIKLFLSYNKIVFLGEKSSGGQNLVDKIRYTVNGAKGYVDIHLSTATSIQVNCRFSVASRTYAQTLWKANTLDSVADAPTGETIIVTHTFSVSTDAETTLTAYGKTFTFRKRNGVVYIDAPDPITPSTNGANAVGTLPAGFIPAYVSRFIVANREANEYKTLVIDASGNVSALCYTAFGVSTPFSITGSYIAQ